MAEPSHIRAISLVLAFSVVAGGWFLFEYANFTQPQFNAAPETATEPLPRALSPSQVVVTSALMPKNMNIMYKCQKGSRISFSDKPCAANERTLAITASEKETPASGPSLAKLQRQAAQMESDRLEREEKFATAAILTAAAKTNSANQIRCKNIDDAVAVKDSELRQPHSAQWGDYLTGERKKLMDERYSVGC